MKTRLLLIISALLSLTACVTHTAGSADPFLQPCVIEGAYKSLDEVMEDITSTTQDIIDFGGNAEDAVKRCNDDKVSALHILKGETK